MASPSSVGDCIAIASVILTGCQALAVTFKDTKLLEGVRSNLERLLAVLQSLSTTEIPTTIGFQKVLQGYFDNFSLFQSFTLKHASSSNSYLVNSIRRLKYSFCGKKELDMYRQGLQQSLLVLVLLQLDHQK